MGLREEFRDMTHEATDDAVASVRPVLHVNNFLENFLAARRLYPTLLEYLPQAICTQFIDEGLPPTKARTIADGALIAGIILAAHADQQATLHPPVPRTQPPLPGFELFP